MTIDKEKLILVYSYIYHSYKIIKFIRQSVVGESYIN